VTTITDKKTKKYHYRPLTGVALFEFTTQAAMRARLKLRKNGGFSAQRCQVAIVTAKTTGVRCSRAQCRARDVTGFQAAVARRRATNKEKFNALFSNTP
jgi:hypothetical protein